MRSPCRGFVRIDSGWNWTAAIGNDLCSTPMTTLPSPPGFGRSHHLSSSGTSTPCNDIEPHQIRRAAPRRPSNQKPQRLGPACHALERPIVPEYPQSARRCLVDPRHTPNTGVFVEEQASKVPETSKSEGQPGPGDNTTNAQGLLILNRVESRRTTPRHLDISTGLPQVIRERVDK